MSFMFFMLSCSFYTVYNESKLFLMYDLLNEKNKVYDKSNAYKDA